MAEVNAVSMQYEPLASSCSSIYFTLEALQQVHFLYQYSLQFFLEIFHASTSNNPNLAEGSKDYTQRLCRITTDLFMVGTWLLLFPHCSLLEKS